jgi:hypothetical protein
MAPAIRSKVFLILIFGGAAASNKIAPETLRSDFSGAILS